MVLPLAVLFSKGVKAPALRTMVSSVPVSAPLSSRFGVFAPRVFANARSSGPIYRVLAVSQRVFANARSSGIFLLYSETGREGSFHRAMGHASLCTAACPFTAVASRVGFHPLNAFSYVHNNVVACARLFVEERLSASQP